MNSEPNVAVRSSFSAKYGSPQIVIAAGIPIPNTIANNWRQQASSLDISYIHNTESIPHNRLNANEITQFW